MRDDLPQLPAPVLIDLLAIQFRRGSQFFLQFLDAHVQAPRFGASLLSPLERFADRLLLIAHQLIDDLLQLRAPFGIDLIAIDLRHGGERRFVLSSLLGSCTRAVRLRDSARASSRAATASLKLFS